MPNNRYRPMMDSAGYLWVEDTESSEDLRFAEWGFAERESARECARVLNEHPYDEGLRDNYYWNETGYDREPIPPFQYDIPPEPVPVESTVLGPQRRFYVVRAGSRLISTRGSSYKVLDQQTERILMFPIPFELADITAVTLNEKTVPPHEFAWKRLSSLSVPVDTTPIVNGLEPPAASLLDQEFQVLLDDYDPAVDNGNYYREEEDIATAETFEEEPW